MGSVTEGNSPEVVEQNNLQSFEVVEEKLLGEVPVLHHNVFAKKLNDDGEMNSVSVQANREYF
jgi:hypothetical protein